MIGRLSNFLSLSIVTGLCTIAACSKDPLRNYKEGTPVRRDIQIKILSTGVVQPENRLDIKSPVGGRVEQVLVREGNVVKKDQPLLMMSSLERAALLDAARARSPEELQKWQEYYKPTPLIAPLNGTVISRNVEPGQTVTTGDALIVMSDRLTVKAQVDETDIAEIKLKQKASIVLDAYPSDPVEGHVDQIAFDARTINSVTTYTVDVLPFKTPHFMRSGMTANVNFSIRTKNSALTVPMEAIRTIEGKSYIMVPSKEHKDKVVERVVDLGVSDGKFVEIAQGLTDNEKFLVPQVNTRALSKGNVSGSPFSPGSGGGGRRGGGGR